MNPNNRSAELNVSEKEPSSLTEVLALAAPYDLGRCFEWGPGFAAHQAEGPVKWKLDSVENKGANTWDFHYQSPQGLRAVCSACLDPDYRAARFRVALTHTSSGTQSFTKVVPLFLRLNGLERLRILSSSGGGSSSLLFCHTKEYPAGSYRTQWIRPTYPRPLEFSSGGCWTRAVGSSVKDLPIFMLSEGADPNGPGMFFGLEWSTSWHARSSFIRGCLEIRRN